VGYLPDGDRFLVCGSNGGSDHPPAWSLNLRAHPDATVEVGARTLSVTASEITGEEYETAWDRYVAANPGFAGYRTKTKRHLPIFHPGRPSQVNTITVGHDLTIVGCSLWSRTVSTRFADLPAHSRESAPQSSPLFAQTDPMRVKRWRSRVGGRSVGHRSPAIARCGDRRTRQVPMCRDPATPA